MSEYTPVVSPEVDQALAQFSRIASTESEEFLLNILNAHNAIASEERSSKDALAIACLRVCAEEVERRLT